MIISIFGNLPLVVNGGFTKERLEIHIKNLLK